jgi:pimeloyl-ACP methyl ester carboxylesterase
MSGRTTRRTREDRVPHVRTSESTIFYEQSGSGPDIVWISGGGDLGSRWHTYQVPFFDDAFRNTTFDNRGIGETTAGTQPWTITQFADDTAGLLAALGIDRA